MDYPSLIGLVLVGTVAGWLNVMAGGGSLLTVPVLLFMGIPAAAANGTNRIGILSQSLAAVITFRRRGFSDLRLSLSLAAFASVGAAGGAMVGVNLQGVWFDRLLAIVMIGVMLSMLFERSAASKDAVSNDGTNTQTSTQPKRLLLGHLAMVVVGFWGGLIQIGVGFILMPVLHKLMGLDLVRVNMHKVFIVLTYTIIALALFASQVDIYWSAGIALALGMAVGGWFGARTTISHGNVWIKRILMLTLSLFIIKLLWF